MTQTELPGVDGEAPASDAGASWCPVAQGFTVGKVYYEAFGLAVAKPGDEQYAFRRELQNKLAWVLGTAYGGSYSKRRDPAQCYASRMVQAILRDHGYKI